VVVAIADAMLTKETSLQSRTPGSKNARMITVSAIAPDCQRNLTGAFPFSVLKRYN
jgi:hypothetical protein